MQRISIELAAAGMKLAKLVKNKRGMTLCGAGTELTEEIIERLSDMGVKRITVEGHPVDYAHWMPGEKKHEVDALDDSEYMHLDAPYLHPPQKKDSSENA